MRPLAFLPLWAWLCCVATASGTCTSDGRHRTRACIVEDLNSSSGTATPATLQESQPAVPMPAAVRAILEEEEFEAFDEPERARAMRAFQKELLGFQHFPHARDTFAQHLRGTWGILNAWGQGPEISRAGMFHTAYGGDLFIFSTLDPFEPTTSRQRLRAVVGEEAEALTWQFGTAARSLVNRSLHLASDAALPPGGMTLASFAGGEHELPARQIAKIMVVTIADYLDQLVEVNNWRDFHSYDAPSVLFPGPLKPEVALYWMSRVCRGIREHLDVVPTIFEGCTQEIDFASEKTARDLYWEAVSGEGLSREAREGMMQRAASANPFIAEPHVYLAEMKLQGGQWAECVAEAREAIRLFYQMGAHWDKRLPYRHWVHNSRLLLLRCSRRLQGKTSLPLSPQGVVPTLQLVAEMAAVSPLANTSEGGCAASAADGRASVC